MPLYHVIAWGLPVLIGLCFLSTDTLLYAPFVSGINAFHVAIKVPEFFGYLLLVVLYLTTISIMCKKVRECTVCTLQLLHACSIIV